MRVLFVTAEACPLAKSGGLADVSSALPIALVRRDVDVRILMPGYPEALARLEEPRIECRLEPLLDIEDVALISGRLPGTRVPVLLLHAPALFARNGLYRDKNGQDWPDNAKRFAALCHAAVRISVGGVVGWRPDVIHANDWHAGLIPLLLTLQPSPARATSVTTIHNLAYQGNFPATLLPELGIPERLFTVDGAEFYGQISFLKAAIRFSDKVTTVSPSYAKEVLQPEFGCGLDGLLRSRGSDFVGILNGIDNAAWNPVSDSHLAQNYSMRDIAGKRVCKARLQAETGLTVGAEIPLIGFVSRVVDQKMADVVLAAVPRMVDRGAQFVLLGQGERALETGFESMARAYPERVAVKIGYDEALAHRLQAGTDILLAPARFEPCGLTQLYALAYGTVPVVRRTGGLADTVTDVCTETLANRTATGVVFERPDLQALESAITRAMHLYQEPLTWRRIQLQGMAQDFGWDRSAARYAALYREVAGFDEAGAALPEFVALEAETAARYATH